MNALLPSQPSLPGTRPPELPADLRRLVGVTMLRHWSQPADPHPEAARFAEIWRQYLEPADPETVEDWGLALAAGHPNAPSGKGLKAWLELLSLGAMHLSAGCFTPATLGLVANAAKFFPSVGDICAVLQPIHERQVNELRALERMAAARPIGKPKESTRPYGPVPVPAHFFDRTPRHRGSAEWDREADPSADRGRVARQLAALGYPPRSTEEDQAREEERGASEQIVKDVARQLRTLYPLGPPPSAPNPEAAKHLTAEELEAAYAGRPSPRRPLRPAANDR